MRLPTLLIPLLLLTALGACSRVPSTPHPPVVIRLGGADSMQLLMQDLAKAYRQSHPYATIEIRGGNSNSGLVEFARGSLDIALVSRNPTSEELKQPPARAVEIARDGIVVIVNPSNPLTNITREQLFKVFAGETQYWSQLTGQLKSKDDSIQVVSREDGSGTRSVFEQTIMMGRRVTLTALIEPSSRGVLEYVKANANAIGYVAFNLWRVNSGPRALSVDGTSPTTASVQSSSFPLMQTYYLVVPLDANPPVSDFVDFVLSASVRDLIYARESTTR